VEPHGFEVRFILEETVKPFLLRKTESFSSPGREFFPECPDPSHRLQGPEKLPGSSGPSELVPRAFDVSRFHFFHQVLLGFPSQAIATEWVLAKSRISRRILPVRVHGLWKAFRWHFLWGSSPGEGLPRTCHKNLCPLCVLLMCWVPLVLS